MQANIFECFRGISIIIYNNLKYPRNITNLSFFISFIQCEYFKQIRCCKYGLHKGDPETKAFFFLL